MKRISIPGWLRASSQGFWQENAQPASNPDASSAAFAAKPWLKFLYARPSVHQPKPAPILVQRQVKHGWKIRAGKYHGHFNGPDRKFEGIAERRPSGKFDLFIRNPPRYLHQHSHWSCLGQFADDWYMIHVTGGLDNLSAGIQTIENILHEAYQNKTA